MRVSQLLSKENRWTKNALARDGNGKAIDCLDLIHFHNGHTLDLGKNAVAYSILGAIAHCYSPDDHEQVLDKIHSAMRKVLNDDMYIAKFNDAETTTFEDVKKVIEIAGV